MIGEHNMWKVSRELGLTVVIQPPNAWINADEVEKLLCELFKPSKVQPVQPSAQPSSSSESPSLPSGLSSPPLPLPL